MSVFFMFGKYTSRSVREISPEHTRKILEIVGDIGGKVKEMYAVMGAYDLVLVVEFPNLAQALQASVSISRELDISFSTMPALPIEEFDRLVGKS
ncbi:MAG: GYD domain-containing protein [Calditrichaeota bacterium]|nr:MAG: GYD domain-containing protein [Calditrichota bacterium]